MDSEINKSNNPQRADGKSNPHPKHKKKHHYRPHQDNNQNQQQKNNNQQNTEKNTKPVAQEAKNQHNKPNHKHRPKHHKNNNHPANNNAKEVKLDDQIIQEESTVLELTIDAEETYQAPVEAESVVENPTATELVEIIGVRFKESGKTYYFEPNGIVATKSQPVIVETSRGLEFGKVAIANSMVSESEFVSPLRPVIRIATPQDIKHYEENLVKQEEAGKICNEKIIAHKLDMKLIDVQYTFDNSKLLFYFTSSGRVDFRELVKDLASVFKTRIELRQIGIRDEAKLIGGLGICGRPLCCSVFLSDFGQVSIKMAKEQNLSLNSSKISGACGRLMCCLRYEYETYQQELKELPAVDTYVKTPDGKGTVTELMPLAGKIKVRLDEKPDQQPKAYTKDTVTVIPKQK